MERITVVKIGGNVIDNPAAMKRFLKEFAALEGPKILVHGGGKLATRLAERLELKVQMVDGRRITDKGTLDVVTMVYAGLINKQAVAGLQAAGCNALGLSGADGNAVTAIAAILAVLTAADAARVDLTAVCQLEDQITVVIHIDVVKAAVGGRSDGNLAAIPLHIRAERLQHRADGQIRVAVLHERRRVHGHVLPVDRDVALADGYGDGGAALRDDGRAAHAVPLHVAAVLFHDHAKRDLRSAVRIDKRLARFRGERDLLSVQFNTDVVLRRKGGHRKAQQHCKDKCNAQCALFYFCHKSNSLPKCSLLA